MRLINGLTSVRIGVGSGVQNLLTSDAIKGSMTLIIPRLDYLFTSVYIKYIGCY